MITDTVTTVLAAAASYNLTSLANARDELSIKAIDTTNDAYLTRAITQISKTIMNDTNRTFAPEYIQDIITIERSRTEVPTGLWQVQLSRFPLVMIASLTQLSSNLGTTVTLVEGTDFRADYDSGELIRLDSSTGLPKAWEAMPITIKYIAGYGAYTAEPHTIPASPYQITVNNAASFSCDQGVTFTSNGTALTAVASGPITGQYSVNPATGTYTFAAADVGKAISTNYATTSTPADLEEVCLRLVAGRFRARNRDPALVQRETPGVGTERFWFGNAPGQQGAFPPDIQAMLNNYHVPVAT